MGVQLNIKSPEARALAEKVAAATGTSITEAVTTALREQLARVKQEKRLGEDERRRRLERVRSIIRGSRELWDPELLAMEDPTDILYDENGCPA